MKQGFEPPFLKWFRKVYIKDSNVNKIDLEAWNQLFDKFFQENLNQEMKFKKLLNSIGQFYGFFNFEVFKHEINLLFFPVRVLDDKRALQDWFFHTCEPFDFLQESKTLKKQTILGKLESHSKISKRFHEICSSWR